MTTPTPREPWDDDRLGAAFRARAEGTRTPIDVVGVTFTAVRAKPSATTWGRLLAPAAVVVLALGAIAGGTALLGSQRGQAHATANPTASPTPSASSDVREALGLPVISVPQAISTRDAGADDRELAVRGWFSAFPPVPCPAPMTWPVTPVEPNCPDQWVILTAEPESLTSVEGNGFSGRQPSSASFQIDLDDLDQSWQPRLPTLGPAEPVELVVIGHFDDRRSFACPPEVQQACRDRFVVDRIDSVDGATQPLSISGADGRQTSTAAAVQAIAAEETPGDSILSMAVVDGATGIGRIEPSLGTGRGGFIDQPWAWVVRVLESERSVTYLVIDGTDAIFEMDREGVPVPVGGSARPTGAPSPGAFVTFRFDLVGSEGPVVLMTVVDMSRRLIAARSATPEELGRPGQEAESGRLAVDELSPGILLVRWGGGVCDTALELVVEMGQPINLGLRGDHPPCDAIGIGRGVVLSFYGDIRADQVTSEDLQRAVEARPSRVAGLGVIDVETALKLMTEPNNDRELAVAGWYDRGDPVDCYGLGPVTIGAPTIFDVGCDPTRLQGEAEPGPGATNWLEVGPSLIGVQWVPPKLGPYPVVLVGHFDDRRVNTCDLKRKAQCSDVFIVDGVWADGRLQAVEWSLPSSRHAPTQTDGVDVSPWAVRVAGADAVVLAIGSIETSNIADLEPAFQPGTFDSPWAWHLTVLDPATLRVRTFVIPESAILNARVGRSYTTFEIVGVEVIATTTIID